MRQARTVILDNEAVQALTDVRHRKHRQVLAVVEAVTARNLRRAGSVRLVVPTTVRVEAGWDRRAPGAAPINRLRVDDHALDSPSADRAAAARTELGISVADAHLAAAVEATPGPHTVLASDTQDLKTIADHLGTPIHLVAV